MAEDERPPLADEVEVGAAVHVEHARPLTTPDEERLAADRTPGAHGAVHAARYEAARLREELPGVVRHDADGGIGVPRGQAERFRLQPARHIAYRADPPRSAKSSRRWIAAHVARLPARQPSRLAGSLLPHPWGLPTQKAGKPAKNTCFAPMDQLFFLTDI